MGEAISKLQAWARCSMNASWLCMCVCARGKRQALMQCGASKRCKRSVWYMQATSAQCGTCKRTALNVMQAHAMWCKQGMQALSVVHASDKRSMWHIQAKSAQCGASSTHSEMQRTQLSHVKACTQANTTVWYTHTSSSNCANPAHNRNPTPTLMRKINMHA